jgi:hypothetical protein
MIEKSEFQFFPKAGDRVDKIKSTFFIIFYLQCLNYSQNFFVKKSLLGLT